RHNYRRKNGHRQQHTILKIIAIGAQEKKAKAKKADAAPVSAEAEAPAAQA
ncbi:MAG: 50S ribosomal protein L21, partial [Sphingomonas sp.]